ncbi:MAG: hypothetical protein ACETWR_24355 [Anaerolineae bacterium]
MNNGRVFRKHRLVNLILPGLPWFSLIVLISGAVLYGLPYSDHATWLFILAVFPFLKLFRLYLAWLGYSVSTTAGSNVLAERSGLLNVSERLIPLTEFGPVAFDRHWWASLFGIDVADITIAAMGGPFVLASIGDSSDFRVVLQSRGEEVPPKRPSVFVTLLGLLLRSGPVLLRRTFTGLFALGSSLVSRGRSALAWLMAASANWASSLNSTSPRAQRRAVPSVNFAFDTEPPPTLSKARTERAGSAVPCHGLPDSGYLYRGVPFSSLIPSEEGFFAFCHQFILTDKNWTKWHYRARDASRRYYPDGIFDQAAHFYLCKLREVCIIIPGPNGCSGERLSARIRSIRDIQRLIPDLSESPDKIA